MKKILFLIIILNSISFSQYYAERSTEQSFEQSSLYFNSHFLNTFGTFNFRNITPGLIDDPFLNLSVNPANYPSMEDQDLHLYLDFRGDRTEAPVIRDYVMPMYYADVMVYPYYPRPDSRLFAQTRTEPEPILSIGVITNPLKEITNKFFIGGSYQVLYKEEKFYTPQYWIYSPNIYYDGFGVRALAEASYHSFPVQDRYAGKDEMITDGHLYSVFSGYNLTDKLSIGLFLDGVIHSREGEYFNNYSDPVNAYYNYESSNSSSQSKNEDYNHTDISAGINYKIKPGFLLGVKAGILNGEANQQYTSASNYLYKHNTPEVSTEWYYNVSTSSTEQNWKHDGKTTYFGFNFTSVLNESAKLNAYYKYSSADIDITNNTIINDTSFNSSRYYNSYDTSYYMFTGNSSTHDIRTGTGNESRKVHEIMVNVNWRLTEVTSVYGGIYIKSQKADIASAEPVTAMRTSNYLSATTRGLNNYDYHNMLFENKILEWNYTSDYRTIQVPIIFDFNFGDKWGVMLGINKIFNRWKIEDQTVAYFYLRDRDDNGTTKTETNFGERYKQPTENYTDNMTKILTSFYVNLSRQFKVRLLLDPEFEHQFRVAQWWLSFEARI